MSAYALNTVTYGTTSAPYLAIKCLRKLGMDYKEINPRAANAILSDFYMDDLMTGGHSEEEVHTLAREIYGKY